MHVNNLSYHSLNGFEPGADLSTHVGENPYNTNNTYTNTNNDNNMYCVNPDMMQNGLGSSMVSTLYNDRVERYNNIPSSYINEDMYRDMDKITPMTNNHIQPPRPDIQVNQVQHVPMHYPQSQQNYYYQTHNLYKPHLTQKHVTPIPQLSNGVQSPYMRQLPYMYYNNALQHHQQQHHPMHSSYDQNYYHMQMNMKKFDQSKQYTYERPEYQQLNGSDPNLKYRIIQQKDPSQFYPVRAQTQHYQPQIQFDLLTKPATTEEQPIIESGNKGARILNTVRPLAEILTNQETDSFSKAKELISNLLEQFGPKYQQVLSNIQYTNPSCQSLVHLPFMLWGSNNSNYFCEHCIIFFIFKSDKFINKNLNITDTDSHKRNIPDENDKTIKKSKPKSTNSVVVLDYNTEMIDSPLLTENFVGMINIGAGSCFLNAIIQCLSNIKPFVIFYLKYKETLPSKESLGFVYEDYIRSASKFVNKSGRKVDKNRNYTSFNWEMALMINYFWRSHVRSIRPEALFNNCSMIIPNFNPSEMQDCDEYLQNLLNLLDAELIAASKSSDISQVLMEMANVQIPTGINVIFGGMELDNIKCLNCNTVNSRLVPYRILSLPMKKIAQSESLDHPNIKSKDITKLTKITIQDCLDLHFSRDILSVSNGEGYECNVCKSKQNAEKYCNLVSDNMPFILFITLKRFVCGKETYKIWNPVEFSEVLDLTQYTVDYRNSDIPRASKRISDSNITICSKCYGLIESYKSGFKEFKCRCAGQFGGDDRVLYKLIGQVQHDGPSTSRGHYYSYYMHPITRDWYMADDVTVKRQNELVLAPCPYILVYQRVFNKPFKIDIPSFT